MAVAKNYEDMMYNLFSAIDKITDERLNGLHFNKTVLCTITNADNREKGEYTVTDGKTTFIAYSENKTYAKGENVQVNIPNGDYSQQKNIIGKYVQGQNTEYYTYTSPLENFLDMTGDLAAGHKGTYGLCANAFLDDNNRVAIGGNYIEIFSNSYEDRPIKGCNKLGISAYFKTLLSNFDLIKGNYGLRIVIDGDEYVVPDDADSALTRKIYTFELDNSQMYGDTYNFETMYKQEYGCDIEKIQNIYGISVYFYQAGNFMNEDGYVKTYFDDNTLLPNIFVEKISLKLGHVITDLSQDQIFLYTMDSPFITYAEGKEGPIASGGGVGVPSGSANIAEKAPIIEAAVKKYEKPISFGTASNVAVLVNKQSAIGGGTKQKTIVALDEKFYPEKIAKAKDYYNEQWADQVNALKKDREKALQVFSSNETNYADKVQMTKDLYDKLINPIEEKISNKYDITDKIVNLEQQALKEANRRTLSFRWAHVVDGEIVYIDTPAELENYGENIQFYLYHYAPDCLRAEDLEIANNEAKLALETAQKEILAIYDAYCNVCDNILSYEAGKIREEINNCYDEMNHLQEKYMDYIIKYNDEMQEIQYERSKLENNKDLNSDIDYSQDEKKLIERLDKLKIETKEIEDKTYKSLKTLQMKIELYHEDYRNNLDECDRYKDLIPIMDQQIMDLSDHYHDINMTYNALVEKDKNLADVNEIAGDYWVCEDMGNDFNFDYEIYLNPMAQQELYKVIMKNWPSFEVYLSTIEDGKDIQAIIEKYNSDIEKIVNSKDATAEEKKYKHDFETIGQLKQYYDSLGDVVKDKNDKRAIPLSGFNVAYEKLESTFNNSVLKYYTSNIVVFRNQADVNQINAARMVRDIKMFVDRAGFNGGYRLYTDDGKIVNSTYSKTYRNMEIEYKLLNTGGINCTKNYSISWLIPKQKTMIKKPVLHEDFNYYTDIMIKKGEEYDENKKYFKKEYNDNKDLVYTALTISDIDAELSPLKDGQYYNCCFLDDNDFTFDETSDENYYIITRNYEAEIEIGKGTEILTKSQRFRIEDTYDPNFTNNTVKCIIEKDGQIYTEQKDLVFGYTGINGTTYGFALDMYNQYGERINAITLGKDTKVKVVPKVFDSAQEDVTDKYPAKNFKYEWYSSGDGAEIIGITKNNEEQECWLNITNTADDNAEKMRKASYYILKCQLAQAMSNINFTGYLPIPVRTNDYYYRIEGPDEIKYDASGAKSAAKNVEYKLYSNDEQNWEDVTWEIALGVKDHDSSTDLSKYTNSNLYPQVINGILVPTAIYMVGNADVDKQVAVIAKRGNKIIWTQPIRIYINQWESPVLNSWDGSLTIDEKNGTILSAMLGAGKKENDNTFSGVLMGCVNEKASIKSEKQIGIYGYNHGQESFGFRIDGTAFLGKTGRGQIKFDGNYGTIQSGNFEITDIIKNFETKDTAPDSDELDKIYDEQVGKVGTYLNLTNGLFITNNVLLRGTIYATSGKIGNWTITSTGGIKNEKVLFGPTGTIESDNFKVDAAGNVTMTGKISNGGLTIETDGHIKNSNGTFDVSADGKLSASSASISGKLTAGSGSKIGPWEVTDSAIYNGQNALKSGGSGVYIGTGGIGLGNGQFWVDSSGNVHANKITLAEGGTDIDGTNIASYVGDIVANNITANNVIINGQLTTLNARVDGKLSASDIDATFINSRFTDQTGFHAEYGYIGKFECNTIQINSSATFDAGISVPAGGFTYDGATYNLHKRTVGVYAKASYSGPNSEYMTGVTVYLTVGGETVNSVSLVGYN